MAPRTTRRRYIAALSALSATAIAGCTGSPDSDSDATTESTPESTTREPTTAEPTTEEMTSEAVAETPIAPIKAFVSADDVETFQAQFHPLHPFHADNLDEADAESFVDNGLDAESLEAHTVDQAASPELVRSATVPGNEVDSDSVTTVLDDAETAVVEATMTDTDGNTNTARFVTVTHDGEWVILAQGVPTTAEVEASQLDARVVAGVAFEPDLDAARVQFVSDPVADSVTFESTTAGDESSTTRPGEESYLEVDLDADGDEVVVSATIDGESRVVHRERYPESDRLVDSIEFDDNPDDSRDAIARVVFNDTDEDGRVRVESTAQRGASEADPVKTLNYLDVGVDPKGDEVVVTYPVGGQTEEVHRERYHP